MNRINTTLIVIYVFFSNIVFGQSYIDTIVNKKAKQYMSNNDAVGLSIGVYYHTKNFKYNYGIEKLSNPEQPTEKSIYSIGSISKTFIAMLLANAVLNKHVSLQDDIRKYLPDSVNFDNLQFNQQPVRLVHLSNHTACIPSQLAKLPAGWNHFTPYQKYDFKKQYTKNLFLKDLQHITLDTFPGYKYEYSNAGYKVLSIMLENIYKLPYEELMNRFVTRNVSMNDTKVYLSKTEWERFASGSQDINLLTATKNIDDFTSGPVLYSTVDDMLKYISYNIEEKNKAIQLTHRKTFNNNEQVEIGLAWKIAYTPDGERYFYHSGSGTGCNSICLFSTTKKIGVIVLANETSDQKKIIELGTNILLQLANYEP